MMFPKHKERPSNEMTIDEFKMAYPKKKWSQPERSNTMKAECSESQLQTYLNELLELKGWQYLRFPDGFLRWMKLNAPSWIQAIFFHQIGGRMPDNLILLPLKKGMFLTLKLELKTQDKKGRAVGRTHGKQKRYAEFEEWPIARSPEQINTELDKLENILQKIKIIIEND
jgi:hypothetical protein